MLLLAEMQTGVQNLDSASLKDGLGKRTDFHGFDGIVFNGEPMTNFLVGQKASSQVADDLMDLDQDLSVGLRVKRERLDVRVDFAPLLGPVSADFLRASDETSLERPRPSHIRRHQGESRINVPRIESGVGRAEQFDVW